MTNTNRYIFSGKEKQTIRDLGWLDFMARMYANCEMPIFTTQDPLAEKYYSVSPYIYCMNNPLRFIDPNGMALYNNTDRYYTPDGTFLGDDEQGYNVRIVEKDKWDELTNYGININPEILQNDKNTKLIETAIEDGELSLEGISNILTDILNKYDMSDMYNDKISVWGLSQNMAYKFNSTLFPSSIYTHVVSTININAKSVEIIYLLHNVLKKNGGKFSGNANWINNYNDIISLLYVHEYLGRYVNKYDNAELYQYQIEQNKKLKLNISSDYKNHLLKKAGYK
jgi:RHS repeat-associated protein